MPRPKVYDDHLRSRLITRAAATLAAAGPESFSLRPLAAAEGTSTSAVYAMFGGKAGLVAAVVEAAQHSFIAAQRGAPTTADARDDLAALGHAYRDWALAHPTLYSVMFGGRVVPDCAEPSVVADRGAEAIGCLQAIVERLVQEDVFRAEPIETITTSVWASVHGLVSLEIAGMSVPSDAAARQRYSAHLAAIGRGWLV